MKKYNPLPIILLLVAAILFSGCSTQKRAMRLIAKADRIDETALPIECGRRYPVKESVTTKIEYKQGKTDTIQNVVKVDCDTVIARHTSGRVISVPCPPSTHTTDTVFTEKVSIQENTAQITALEAQLKQCASDKEKAQNQAANRGKLMWGLAGAWALFFIFKAAKNYFLPIKKFIG